MQERAEAYELIQPPPAEASETNEAAAAPLLEG